MTATPSAFAAFLSTGELPPDLFSPNLVADFNVPSWRFGVHGPAAFAAQRGEGPWQVVVEQTLPTPSGFVIELSHEHDGEYYRTLSVVTVENERITEFVHYCTGNWDAAARRAYAESTE